MDKVGSKRTADWLEKISAGAMLIGLFENNIWAIILGVALQIASIHLSRRSA